MMDALPADSDGEVGESKYPTRKELNSLPGRSKCPGDKISEGINVPGGNCPWW